MGGRGQFSMHSDCGWDSAGGYMNAKIQKLQDQFTEKSKSVCKISSVFEGIAIHVNGYTNPSSDELKTLMAQHGGSFHNYYSSTATTHVIASNLPRAKIKDMRPNQNVVKPQWIMDSINQGKLLPIHPYLVGIYGSNKSSSPLGQFISKNTCVGNKSERVSWVKQCDGNQGTNKEVNSKNTASENSDAARTSKELVTRSIKATTDTSFLSEFYSHSRLHFLSTWKVELADYVRKVITSPTHELVGCNQLMELASQQLSKTNQNDQVKYIVHIDMDCFFVSVGLLSRPHLQDCAVAVTHHSSSTPSHHKQREGTDPDFERNYYYRKRSKQDLTTLENLQGGIDEATSSASDSIVPSYSEIASCNYEARKSGLRNGMFYGKAKELCPNLVAIPYDFEAYRDASQKLYDVLTSYTRKIEAVSCDEALLDATGLVSKTGLSPTTIVQHIRAKVKTETGCNASAGIGPNIALARMATRVGKPNGQHLVTPENTQSFIWNNPVKHLPGVGYATASRLEELGATTCGELQGLTLDELKKEFGTKTGQKLYELSRGIDKREVSQSKERKSVSADVNYGIRLSNQDEMSTFTSNLAAEVSDRLKKAEMMGKKITLKLMVRRPDAPAATAKFGGHGVCYTVSRSSNIDGYSDDSDVIKMEVLKLMRSAQVNVVDLRGIGIQVTQLKPTGSVKPQTKSSILQFIKPRLQTENNVSTEEKPTSWNTVDLTSTHDENKSSNVDDKVTTDPQLAPDRSVSASQNGISASFLDALPDDIRQEVESDLHAQQQALRSKVKPVADSPKKKVPIMVSFKKSPAKRKRTMIGQKASDSSPNKLITDMFQVLASSGKNLQPESQQKTSRRNLADSIDLCTQATSTTEDHRPPSPPSLGGVMSLEGARDAIREWTKTFMDSAPLESDISEVERFLVRLVLESRDMSSACLILHTLRRSLLKLIEDCNIVDTQTEYDRTVTSWISIYNRIAGSLCDVVKSEYSGAILNVKYIT